MKQIKDMYTNSDASVADYLRLARSLPEFSGKLPWYMRAVRAAFLSSFTIKGLPEVCRVRGVFHNIWLDTYEAPYNQFTQEIVNYKSALYQFDPHLIYIAVDSRDFLDKAHRENLIAYLLENSTAKIVLCDFDGSMGQYQNPRVFIFDFVGFLEKIGKTKYWNTKYAVLGDFRLAPDAFPLLAERFMGYAVVAAGNTKKCLVLDLDNTLWEGIAGEDELKNIKPRKKFQEHILELYKKGILLVINSKNNFEDAMEVIENHPGMVLRRNHFAAYRINWQDKALNMAELTSELNLGLESFVFVDDDPLERDIVKNSFPEIAVLPPDMFLDYAGFSSFVLTEEDLKRGDMYLQENKRKEFQKSFRTTEDFLREIKLEISVKESSREIIPRISQLTQKTNQFNLTTRRYDENDINSFLSAGGKVWGIEVRDSFGDYGLTGVCMIQSLDNQWKIDNFLLSCRILGRGIEKAFMGYVVGEAKRAGVEKIIAEFIRTPKNKPCESFLDNAGFSQVGNSENSICYEFNMPNEYSMPDFIKIV